MAEDPKTKTRKTLQTSEQIFSEVCAVLDKQWKEDHHDDLCEIFATVETFEVNISYEKGAYRLTGTYDAICKAHTYLMMTLQTNCNTGDSDVNRLQTNDNSLSDVQLVKSPVHSGLSLDESDVVLQQQNSGDVYNQVRDKSIQAQNNVQLHEGQRTKEAVNTDTGAEQSQNDTQNVEEEETKDAVDADKHDAENGPKQRNNETDDSKSLLQDKPNCDKNTSIDSTHQKSDATLPSSSSAAAAVSGAVQTEEARVDEVERQPVLIQKSQHQDPEKPTTEDIPTARNTNQSESSHLSQQTSDTNEMQQTPGNSSNSIPGDIDKEEKVGNLPQPDQSSTAIHSDPRSDEQVTSKDTIQIAAKTADSSALED